MFTNTYHYLLILAAAFCFLLLFPSIKCEDEQIQQTSTEDEQIQQTSTEDKLQTSTLHTRLSFILQKQQDASRQSNEDRIKQLLEEFFRIYPYRRASSFHAMRGKRFIQAN